MKRFFTKIFLKFGIILDSLNNLLKTVLILISIVITISVIAHNLMKIGETTLNYSGEYKNLYTVNNNQINVYIKGDNEKKIVLLSDWGVTSPILEYKLLTDKLSDNFTVIVIENFGYGLSYNTDDDRTNENITSEINNALNATEITGPYIFMGIGISNIYIDYYSKLYPENISGIISLDAIYSDSLDNNTFPNEYLPNLISNVKFDNVINLAGYYRWKLYLNSDAYNIDKLEKSENYTQDEIKLYKKLIVKKTLSQPMREEIFNLKNNLMSNKDYQYLDNLQTLQILTEDKISEYQSRQENIKEYAKNKISNKQIQKIENIDGSIYDYLFDNKNINKIINMINKNFIN